MYLYAIGFFVFLPNLLHANGHMKPETIYKRTINLLISPKTEWEVIKAENKTQKQVLRDYAIPMIIFLAICSVIGNSIYGSRMLLSIPYIIFNGIAMVIIGYAGVYISGLIVNETTPSFNTKKDINLTFNIIVYSLSAYTVFMAIAFILPSPFFQIRLFGIYSLYLFWIGCGTLSGTPLDNKVGFVFVSNLIQLGIFFILSTIFSIILKGTFGLSLILK
jgi:hypothetical protein